MMTDNMLEWRTSMKKKQKGNSKIIWATVIFVVLASALIISPMITMDRTKTSVIEYLNEKYDDEFVITHSNLSKTPFKDTFSAIVQSQVTGAAYNADVVDGKGTIPDYELETYYMTYNTMAEELFPDSLALTYAKDKDITVRVLTVHDITQAQMDEYEQQVKAEYNDVKVAVETIQVSEEVFEQMQNDIPVNYQRSVIAPEANFDNFETVIKNYNF